PSAAVIPTLLCPSDDNQQRQVVQNVPGPLSDDLGDVYGTCAYRANGGPASFSLNAVIGLSATFTTRIADITDGTSTTLLLGEWSTHHDPLFTATISKFPLNKGSRSYETSPTYTSWSRASHYQIGSSNCGGYGLPMNWQIPNTSTSWIYPLWYAFSGYGSNHPGGANFFFCDGSVHFLPNSVSTTMVGDITLLVALSTRAGDEVIPEGGY